MILSGIIGKKDGQWTQIDPVTTTVAEILALKEFRITVSETEEGEKQEIRDADIRTALGLEVNTAMTLKEFIDEYDEGETPFPRYGVTYLGQVDMLLFRDLFDYPVNVTAGNSGYGPGTTIPDAEKTDIVLDNDIPSIEQNSIDYLFNNCLFSVNGFIYPTVKVNDRMFIIGAAAELRRAKYSSVSVLDFGQLGNVKIHRVQKDDIKIRLRTMDTERNYRSECGITIPDNLNDKTYFVVSAGILATPDNTTRKLTEKSIYLDVNHSTACERLLKMHYSRRNAYYDNLHFANALDIFKLDAKRLLSQGDSFVVVIDRHDICTKETKVYSTGLANTYSCHRRPNGPLFFEDGRLANYNIRDERPGEVVINTLDNERHHFINEETGEITGNIKTTAIAPSMEKEKMEVRLFDWYAPHL